jgi:hypothetical protein
MTHLAASFAWVRSLDGGLPDPVVLRLLPLAVQPEQPIQRRRDAMVAGSLGVDLVPRVPDRRPVAAKHTPDLRV